MAARYRLRLNKLEFISPVDVPAQETARVLLIKRAGPAEGFARVAKVDDELGLVFCWAFTSTVKGAAYHDLQGDAIDEDFIGAAAEFMASGGATDDMHDGAQSGRVVFAFPMTPEIAKSYGVTTDTTGLMVALKPPPEVLAKFKSGEYTGVSIAGLGTRELIKAKKKPKRRATPAMPYKRVTKVAVLTSVEAGHQHSIDLDDPACCYSDQLMTSYQTAEGATEGHCHAWVYDAATGAVTIAMDSGHTHTVTEVVPPEIIAAAEADDEEPYVEPVEPDGGASVVIVNARGVSTPLGAAPTVKQQENSMTDAEKIADLEKQNARLEKLFALSDAERAHYRTLTGTEADEFVGKSANQRSAVLAEIEKANEVVYTSPMDGSVYRKSDDRRLVEMAKRNDQTTAELALAKAATETAAIEKRAAVQLSHFAKSMPVHVAIVRAIDGIADEAVRKEAHEALRGANAAMLELTKSHGANPGDAPQPGSPQETFNAERTAFAKAKFKVDAPSEQQIRQVTGEFIKTAKGAELYADLNTRGQA